MSDWYEVYEGECYRHKFTHGLVCVTRVRPLEGVTGLVRWEALDGAQIDGVTFEVQEAQHFLEDFDLAPADVRRSVDGLDMRFVEHADTKVSRTLV